MDEDEGEDGQGDGGEEGEEEEEEEEEKEEGEEGQKETRRWESLRPSTALARRRPSSPRPNRT